MPVENISFRQSKVGNFSEWITLQNRINSMSRELNAWRTAVQQNTRHFTLLSRILEQKRNDIQKTLNNRITQSLQQVALQARNSASAPSDQTFGSANLPANDPQAAVLSAMLAELVAIRSASGQRGTENPTVQGEKSPTASENETTPEGVKERFLQLTDQIQAVTRITTDALDQLTRYQIKRLDAVIARQAENVARAKKLAESGNAELLQLEEERLEKLQQQRERFVRQQQALAVIELVANSAVAIAKAAAQGGIAAPITIAATLIALAAGLAQARAQAQAAVPAAEKGGIAGKDHLQPLNVQKGGVLRGQRHYAGGILIEAEAGERIFDRQTSARYHEVFEQMLRYRPDPERLLAVMESARLPVLPELLTVPQRLASVSLTEKGGVHGLEQSFSRLQQEVQALHQTIAEQERLSLSIDDKGIHAITRKWDDKTRRTEKLAG
jgi:hypothetical protein